MVSKKRKNSKADVLKKDILHARKKVEDTFKATKIKIAKAEKDIKKYVKKNPKKAAAIVAGIGAVVGAAITSTLMKTKKK